MSSFIDDHASKHNAAVSGRQQTCGQLKVTITAPGAQGTIVAKPQPSNTTNHLDSCSSTTAMSPSVGKRLRADISSIAAPNQAANHSDAFMGTTVHQGDASMGTTAHQRDSRSLGQSRSHIEPEQGRAGWQARNPGTTLDSVDTGSNADSYADAPGLLAPVDRDSGDPKLQLRTQMQQLSELSHLMSQRMSLSDSGCHDPDMRPEAARDRADAVHSPVPANLGQGSIAVSEAGVTCPLHHVHTAQRDPGEPLGDPTVGEEAAQEAAATLEPSTGNAYIVELIPKFWLIACEPVGVASLAFLSVEALG